MPCPAARRQIVAHRDRYQVDGRRRDGDAAKHYPPAVAKRERHRHRAGTCHPAQRRRSPRNSAARLRTPTDSSVGGCRSEVSGRCLRPTTETVRTAEGLAHRPLGRFGNRVPQDQYVDSPIWGYSPSLAAMLPAPTARLQLDGLRNPVWRNKFEYPVTFVRVPVNRRQRRRSSGMGPRSVGGGWTFSDDPGQLLARVGAHPLARAIQVALHTAHRHHSRFAMSLLDSLRRPTRRSRADVRSAGGRSDCAARGCSGRRIRRTAPARSLRRTAAACAAGSARRPPPPAPPHPRPSLDRRAPDSRSTPSSRPSPSLAASASAWRATASASGSDNSSASSRARSAIEASPHCAAACTQTSSWVGWPRSRAFAAASRTAATASVKYPPAASAHPRRHAQGRCACTRSRPARSPAPRSSTSFASVDCPSLACASVSAKAARGPQTRCDAVMLDARECLVQQLDRSRAGRPRTSSA